MSTPNMLAFQILNEFSLTFSLVQRKEGNVVIHGDIWANNYLFSKTDDNSCLMVDWQFTTTGTMTSQKLLQFKTSYSQLLILLRQSFCIDVLVTWPIQIQKFSINQRSPLDYFDVILCPFRTMEYISFDKFSSECSKKLSNFVCTF